MIEETPATATSPHHTRSADAFTPCTHSRMVDDACGPDGVKTGEIVCVECKTIVSPVGDRVVH